MGYFNLNNIDSMRDSLEERLKRHIQSASDSMSSSSRVDKDKALMEKGFDFIASEKKNKNLSIDDVIMVNKAIVDVIGLPSYNGGSAGMLDGGNAT